MHNGKNKDNNSEQAKKPTMFVLFKSIGAAIALCVCLVTILMVIFEKQYEGKVYPNVTINGTSFGGKTQKEVEEYWQGKNSPFGTVQFELTYKDVVATISGTDIDLETGDTVVSSFDGKVRIATFNYGGYGNVCFFLR